VIQPAVLRGRASYERTMEGWTDDADGDALAHTVRLTDADRQIELRRHQPTRFAMPPAESWVVTWHRSALESPHCAGLE